MSLEDFFEERMKDPEGGETDKETRIRRERAVISDYLKEQRPDEEDLLFMSTLGFIEADFVEREIRQIPGRGPVSLRCFHDRMMVGREGWTLELIYPMDQWTEEEVLRDLEENFDRLSDCANSTVFADVVQEKHPAGIDRSGRFPKIRIGPGSR